MPQSSVWKSTLEAFDNQIAQGDGATGGVAVASIAATFAVSLLRMVLEITAQKKESESHLGQLQQLLEAATIESEHLRQAADEDRAAYAAYRQACHLPRAAEPERSARQAAMRSALEQATETPLRAAGSAVRAIQLCAEAVSYARGDVAADIGGAAAILHGAVRAILTSVDANLRRIEGGGFAAERRDLEERAARNAEQVSERLRP
ncbi:MAG TPA: cyclodeaminase/cyclohydrolase family protein [Bryobacteraceae bacterium]|nr:cyclodeaminase/cyclohydrolase family protein [Bryobacteraceae bacterium]